VVLSATSDRALALGLRTHLVDTLTDVDGIEDIVAHWDRLEGILGGEPAIRKGVLRALDPRGGARFGAQ